MRILVTGASGFIGYNLMPELLKEGHEVVAFSRKNINNPNVECYKGDILNQDDLSEAMKGCDAVINLAAVNGYEQINSNRIIAFNTCIEGTLNLINAFNANELKTLVFASSSRVYGNHTQDYLSESLKVKPSSYMAKLKWQAEQLLSLYQKEISSKDKRIVVLRIFNTYGPGQREGFLIPKIISHIKSGSIRLGNADIKRDYIYVDDVASSIATVLKKAQNGFSCYNVGSGISTSVSELINIVNHITGKNLKLEIDSDQFRNEETGNERADITQLRELGWEPLVSLESGLRKVWEESFR